MKLLAENFKNHCICSIYDNVFTYFCLRATSKLAFLEGPEVMTSHATCRAKVTRSFALIRASYDNVLGNDWKALKSV
jgi:hypothetical protein